MTKVMGVCLRCGSHLVIKDGQFGEFLACPRFPDCRYTQSLRDGIKLYEPPSPYCAKCNHTGLLPFIIDGKVIPYAFIDCECKLSLPEHYQELKLEDFDFPMSYIWQSYYERQITGKPLSSLEPASITPPREVPIIPESPWSREQWQSVQQLKGMVNHLNNKVTELSAKRKPKGQY